MRPLHDDVGKKNWLLLWRHGALRLSFWDAFLLYYLFLWTLEIALLVSFLRTNKFQQMYWDVYQSGRNRSKKQKSLSFNAVDYIPPFMVLLLHSVAMVKYAWRSKQSHKMMLVQISLISAMHLIKQQMEGSRLELLQGSVHKRGNWLWR